MNFWKYLLVAAFGFGVAFLLSNKMNMGTKEYDFSSVEAVVSEEESTSYSSYYNQLTDYQKTLYDTLLIPIANAESKIVLSNINITDYKNNCFAVTTAIQYDHPEYFWFTGGYSGSFTKGAFEEAGEVVFEPIYYEYVSSLFNASSKQEKLEKAVDKVAKLASEHSADDYERIIYVHDYLIENAIYDHEALKEYFGTSHSPSCEYIFSAYGCLVDGKTVCSGYAKAFQLIMQKLGYECSYVTGDAGEAHGWNCIYLDGEGYYVDVTWDDMDLEEENPIYDYAFITDEVLSKTHTIDMMFESPVCNATKYNYFIKRGYYVDTYEFDSTAKILREQSGNSAAFVQYGSLEELGKAYQDLIENGACANIEGISEFSQVYYNEDHYTLTLFK